VVHEVAQVLAPDCAPRCLTDGCRESRTAWLTHYGHWGNRPPPGPRPAPRPLEAAARRRYAHVVKTVRRWRLVDVPHRVVFGTLEAVNDVLAPWVGTSPRPAWSGSTSPSGSLGAVGRRVSTLWKGEDGGGSSWPCSTATTIAVCPMRAYAGLCPSPRRPRQRLRHAGATLHAAMAAGLTTMSGRCARCCCFVSRRGRSQQGCEHAAVVGTAKGRA